MRDDLTVIYYTSNQEKEEFESRIRQNLLKQIGDIPLISVSQKPIDFGKNLCVGDVGISEVNCRRQLLIGARSAKTKYICAAESDFLYPPDYFKFVPTSDTTIFLIIPIYVLFSQRKKKTLYAAKVKGCEGAMMVNREYIIQRLEHILSHTEKWQKKRTDDRIIPQLLTESKLNYFKSDIGAISFKTDENMHRRTPVNWEAKHMDLPHWGNARELRRKYHI